MLKTIWIWGAFLIVQAIIVLLFVPATVVLNAAYQEEAILASTLGPDLSESISIKAKDTFQSAFVDTGIMAETFNVLVPSEASKRKSTGMETLMEGAFEVVRQRLESAWNLVFVALQRFYAIAAWTPLILPFLIASAYDGAAIRKVKLLTFGMSSAPIYGMAMHLLVLMLFFPLYYALWPFAAPPLIVPLWLITSAMLIRTLISNMHRM